MLHARGNFPPETLSGHPEWRRGRLKTRGRSTFHLARKVEVKVQFHCNTGAKFLVNWNISTPGPNRITSQSERRRERVLRTARSSA